MIDYLSCLPGVTMRREVLNVDSTVGLPERVSPRAVIQHLCHSVGSVNAPIGGAKLLFYQLEARGITVEDLLGRFPEARFVVVYREALAESFVSNLVAHRTGDFQGIRGPGRTTVVRVDPDELMTYCDRIRRQYERALTTLEIYDRTLKISYEDLRDRSQHVVGNEITRFWVCNRSPSRPIESSRSSVPWRRSWPTTTKWLPSSHRPARTSHTGRRSTSASQQPYESAHQASFSGVQWARRVGATM